MYKVLIVDDDCLILEDICRLIRWENSGFRNPLAAQSAAQALDILEHTSVDLVITDISMPKMDGVELIRKAKELYPDIVFTVLSNYDDFLSVKEAMKAGAIEYLLKYEIEPDTLTKFIRQMSREIRLKKQALKERQELLRMQMNAQDDLRYLFWQQVYHGQLDHGQMCEQAQRLDLPISGGVWIPALVEFADQNSLKNIPLVWEKIRNAVLRSSAECEVSGAPIGDNLMLIVVFIPEVSFMLVTALETRIFRTMQENFLCADMSIFMCVGRICMQLGEITENLYSLRSYDHLRFYEGYGKVVGGIAGFVKRDSAFIKEFPFQQYKALTAAMRTGSVEETEEMLESFRAAVLSERPPEGVLKREVIRSFGDFRDSMKDQRRSLTDMEKAATCQEFFDVLEEVVKECGQANRILCKISRREIRDSVVYLYQHYRESITLSFLSERACMSRAYFCKVFKDEVGCNYTDFLNQIRIDHAMQLLRESNLHTKEVAEQTGFTDYRYFCRLFKAITGKTCGEYRRNCLQEREDELGEKENTVYQSEI